MSKENEKTLAVYKEKAHLYLNNSIEHDKLDPIRAKQKREKLEKLITSNFSSLPGHAKVFEIGSGDGSNAKFIQNLGFDVTASDTADDFIKATQNQGLKTIKFNAPPTILDCASIVGPKEAQGPLAKYFDQTLEDEFWGEKTWEKAESKIVKETAWRTQKLTMS